MIWPDSKSMFVKKEKSKHVKASETKNEKKINGLFNY
tara:strand:- start:370 stop:480 length:111 start_codon:yes stop_codon:yes gene_type:complete